MKKRGLGRGLKELLGENRVETNNNLKSSLSLSDISVGASQPRKSIDNEIGFIALLQAD